MPCFEEFNRMRDSTLEPVAIVGMACRLPGGIGSPSSLWEALRDKRSMQTPKVPPSRFNVDAYLHERLERPGSFNVPGGYFLDGNADDFDPTFFNMTPIEAMWLDPQQRKMLEVTYECLESAGLTLESVAGSDTAVYVGSFTSDYQQMSTKDGDWRHNYAATGVDPGLISARIGNAFDLRGPSFTINTACSSAIYAIHSACNTLRARDASAAIAGGVNLILTVDQHMNTAKLGILSPTSTCHTFDAVADGYGRAEGAGALYLKRLSDAIRDGDPVRGVIRSSAVNTNGKVPGAGITHPSRIGQERVVRYAYDRAGLDPQRTAYVECHGTGTPVGDPIETYAVAKAMNDTRTPNKPLLVGALKANIGHSEAASGIFAVMKAALMTEAAVIPGVAGFRNLNPAILEKSWNIKVNIDTGPWPTDFSERRAGVSSFGYGGTNGHVVVEAIDVLEPLYSHGHRRGTECSKATRPFLLPFSAHDRKTLEQNIVAHAAVAPEYHLADLAYTLGVRRSKLSTRGFVVAAEPLVQADLDLSAFTVGTTIRKQPSLAFIFTGQGAQWPALGAKAMEAFPSFRSTVQKLDRVLRYLDVGTRPTWSLENVLSTHAESGDIDKAHVSQPVCTAVQIAIVDLFASWGIDPAVTIGHSSGEIAAAYTAGMVSAPEAIIIAFLRGYAVSHYAPTGSMLAIGLGAQAIADYRSLLSSELVIACHNSPNSTTLSGSLSSILKAKDILTTAGVFVREIRTGKAYHSPHMSDVAAKYEHLLNVTIQRLNAEDLEWSKTRIRWFSSVTGREYTNDYIPVSYWSENLRSRVLFDEAITSLGRSPRLEDVDVFIEIGPHSALAGPFKQICKANKLDRFTYIASLVRGEDSAVQLLKTAGSLFIRNYHVDLEEVNSVENSPSRISIKEESRPKLLVDLPPYQWNYSKRYWVEPRFSYEQRNITHMRHDLLGSSIVGLSKCSLAWRNILRHSDLPWLKDHTLGKESVLPAAAHLSMAIEALWQVYDHQSVDIQSATLRDVFIETALVIPDNDNGVEVQFRLSRVSDSRWFTFVLESYSEGQWRRHSGGSIAHNFTEQKTARKDGNTVDIRKLQQHTPGKRWYNAFDRVGFEYGSSFQPLRDIRTSTNCHQAAADVSIAMESGLIVGESRYLLHPSSIDGCIQLIIISINAGLHKEIQCGAVPIAIEELSIWPPIGKAKSIGEAVAWTDEVDNRHFKANTRLATRDGKVLLEMKNVRLVSYEAAVPQRHLPARSREPYTATAWAPDITSLTTPQFVHYFPGLLSEEDAVAMIVALVQHKKHISKSILLGHSDGNIFKALSRKLPETTQIMLPDVSNELLESLVTGVDLKNISAAAFGTGLLNFSETTIESQDLVIVGKEGLKHSALDSILKEVASLLTPGGKAIFSIPKAQEQIFREKIHQAGFMQPELCLPHSDVVVVSSTFLGSGVHLHVPSRQWIVVFSTNEVFMSISTPLSRYLQEHGCLITVCDLTKSTTLEPQQDVTYIIHDAAGTLLSSLTEKTFATLKTTLTSGNPVIWLSTGVNEGSCVSGGMVQGMLRAIRSEQASARILLLDVDTSESAEAVGQAVLNKLGQIETKHSGADTEYWLSDGVLKIPRAFSDKSLNDDVSADLAPAKMKSLPLGQALSGKFVDGEVAFESTSKSTLRDADVEIQVEYASIDATALQAHTGTLSVVSGSIIAVGTKLDPSFVGQKAVAYAASPYRTILRVPFEAVAVYSDLEGTTLTATLPGLSRAVNAVLDVGKVQAADRVLVLPASQGFMAAVAELQRSLGFGLAVVVESEQDMSELISRTGLHPDQVVLSVDVRVDLSTVVIAHDFSTPSQEIWRSMPPVSRFILVDSFPSISLDPLPFTKSVSFLTGGVEHLYKTQQIALGGLLTRTLAFMKKHSILWKPSVHENGELGDSEALFRAVDSVQNLVVKFGYGESHVTIRPSSKTITFSPDAAYFLIGCLGGLGRSLTTFMMERGARDFVFLSRSAADKPPAAALIREIEQAGARVTIFRGDVSQQSDVDHAVAAVTASRPIKGVVHAAMVLHDTLFDSMTFPQFTAALTPKVQGAQNLHNAFQDKAHALDFFVLTSSISATIGNPGQTNYCAANSFLDSLAQHRRQHGLPATSLVLPMVLDVGVVAENAGIEDALARRAMYGIDEREMLRGFEVAMLQLGASAKIIMGLEPAYLSDAMVTVNSSGSCGPEQQALWYNDARFTHLRHSVDSIRASSSSATTPFPTNSKNAENNIAQSILSARSAGPAALTATIVTLIREKLSRMLLIPVEDFTTVEEGGMAMKSVAAYGLDSMVGAELRNWLFRTFGWEVSFPMLLGPTMTVGRLAEEVVVWLGRARGKGE